MKYLKSAVRMLLYSLLVLNPAGLTWAGSPSVLLNTMEDSLQYNFEGLKEKGTAPLYFMAYEVHDISSSDLTAEFGSLTMRNNQHSRFLTIDIRVGSPELDNTHEIRDAYGFGWQRQQYISFPKDDNKKAVQAVLWYETDKAFKQAQEQLIKVKANIDTKVEEEDSSPDFSPADKVIYQEDLSQPDSALSAWEDRLREYSGLMDANPDIFKSYASLEVQVVNKYICNTEGTRLQFGDKLYRLSLYVMTRAEDGMELYRYKSFWARIQKELPSDKKIRETIAKLSEELQALRNAPVVEPYYGPAILVGEATGVFFHEILGHRLEGSELKSEESGQTFKKKVGTLVSNQLISVYDDPTRTNYNGTPLNGYYLYDDEGVKSEKTDLIENGVLKDFLMCRRPIKGFGKSNGHGRRQTGYPVVSRQGNLFVKASETVSYDDLLDRLVEECKKQGKDYGLIFKDVSGGFTHTGRYSPNSFKLEPIMVYRIYVNNRKIEPVRGVDIIGTPLQTFSKIIAVGDDNAVFNGYCGASSGTVPVSAIAPSVLISGIEVQKKPKNQELLPVLPTPRQAPNMEVK